VPAAFAGLAYEVICIDDGSNVQTRRALARLEQQHPCLKVLHHDRPSGLSAALSTGLAAARGDVVVALEGSGQYRADQIPWLVERLSRADLVVGRRHSGRLAKIWQAVLQLPRRLLLGTEVRDPDCVFWAARREAVEGLTLTYGMHRFLGSLVANRGFRVAEIHVDHDRRRRFRLGRESWPSPMNLTSAWLGRRLSESHEQSIMAGADPVAEAASFGAPTIEARNGQLRQRPGPTIFF
jgi:glycosyltransferase involved in cell wall biosynthesis